MSDPSRTAARVRQQRASLVADLTSGALDVRALGNETRAPLVKVVVLAEAVPGVGKVRSRRILAALDVAPEARWGELDPDLAGRVIDALVSAAGGA